MSQQPRRTIVRLSRDERVRDIIAAARQVFVERGFELAAIAEIAAKAGVAEGTIYKYFESKRAVLLAVIEAWYHSMIKDFIEQLSGLQGARNKIYYIVWRHLKSLKDDADLCRLCFNQVLHSDDYHQTQIYQFNRQYTSVFVEVCREGVQNGELRSNLPIALFRDMIFGGIDARISRFLFRSGDAEVDTQATARDIVAMFFDGVMVNTDSTCESVVTVECLKGLASRFEDAVKRLESTASPNLKAPTAKPKLSSIASNARRTSKRT